MAAFSGCSKPSGVARNIEREWKVEPKLVYSHFERVTPPQVSVNPYPWPTGQQKLMFINSSVSADRGAPPLKISLTFPPRIARNFLKTILSKVKKGLLSLKLAYLKSLEIL